MGPDVQTLETVDDASEDAHRKVERRERSGASYEYETHVNTMTGPDTDVEEVFFAGAHCGMNRFFYDQRIPRL